MNYRIVDSSADLTPFGHTRALYKRSLLVQSEDNQLEEVQPLKGSLRTARSDTGQFCLLEEVIVCKETTSFHLQPVIYTAIVTGSFTWILSHTLKQLRVY